MKELLLLCTFIAIAFLSLFQRATIAPYDYSKDFSNNNEYLKNHKTDLSNSLVLVVKRLQ